MVSRYKEIRLKADVLGAADGFLALMGIAEPSEEQHAAALLLGEFVLKVNRNLRLK